MVGSLTTIRNIARFVTNRIREFSVSLQIASLADLPTCPPKLNPSYLSLSPSCFSEKLGMFMVKKFRSSPTYDSPLKILKFPIMSTKMHEAAAAWLLKEQTHWALAGTLPDQFADKVDILASPGLLLNDNRQVENIR